jgi:hypothetical protein
MKFLKFFRCGGLAIAGGDLLHAGGNAANALKRTTAGAIGCGFGA